MAANKNAFILLIAISQVASWTIDLPDIRKFMFEKYENEEHEEIVSDDGKKLYTNIDGNSKHHSEHHSEHHHVDTNYANDYGYDSYMEKKVSGIVRNGSDYLEGLRRAIERYTQFLESCNNRNNSMTRNLTSWQPPMDSPPNMPGNISTPNPPSVNFSRPSLNFTDSPRSSYNTSNMTITCEEVTEKSEQVRRLAQLAMWSTMRLQDLAYARKYQKIDEYEENELILKLAWFLDRLAYLTGYEPAPKEFLPSTTQRPTTVSPVPFTVVPAPEPVKTAMMDCLKENSSVPATERCRYPLPIPDIVRQITNTSGASSPSTESMDVIPMPSRDNIPQQSLELLITSDDNPFRNYPPLSRSKRNIDSKNKFNEIKNPFNQFSFVEYFKNHLSNSKSIVKSVSRVFNREKSIVEDMTINPKKSTNKMPFLSNKSTAIVSRGPNDKKIFHNKKLNDESVFRVPTNEQSSIKSFKRLSTNKITNFKSIVDKFYVKNIKKRSAYDPMTKLMNYYFKYKVWDSSNPRNTNKYEFDKLPMIYDVENHLKPKHVVKRSLFNTKGGHILTPLKNLRSFIHKQRIHYKTHVIQKPKIISHLDNIRHQINLNKVGKVDLKPTNIRKRSLNYENMYLPRQSENPMRDISYYVKNKEGREYNPSLVQAAQVRLGLEQIFQTGNIEIVRRYGSNFNPADPAPFYTGLLRSMADS